MTTTNHASQAKSLPQLLSVCLIITVIVGLTLASLTTRTSNPTILSTRPLPSIIQSSTSAMGALSSTVQYDKQAGFTFAQDFTVLSFNVTAVAQHGPDGTGPAYLLNGLTDMGYWYQVGISYNWGYATSTGTGYTPGFQGIYEVFDPYGTSVYPTTGGGGAMPLTVYSGDIVQFSLHFSNRQVIMATHDWNSSDSASQSYNSFGATTFNGQKYSISSSGFFTGLMTEQYFNTPDNGTGMQVAYSGSTSLSSAWMWMDEFGIQGSHTFLYSKTVLAVRSTIPIKTFNTSHRTVSV